VPLCLLTASFVEFGENRTALTPCSLSPNGPATSFPVVRFHIRAVLSSDPLASSVLSTEISTQLIFCEWLSNVFLESQVQGISKCKPELSATLSTTTAATHHANLAGYVNTLQAPSRRHLQSTMRPTRITTEERIAPSQGPERSAWCVELDSQDKCGARG
jgi:hypothetical protein